MRIMRIITEGERRRDKAVIKLTERVVNIETAGLLRFFAQSTSHNSTNDLYM